MTTADATADAPRRLLLRNRNFLWLWGGDAISQLGTQFTQLAIPSSLSRCCMPPNSRSVF